MSGLTPQLFGLRFQDLMELGRARLVSLAPEWTDHNAHDPGITLMELLAWVAEAQLYSLARLRRDERAAYAALLGLGPTGTVGATGLLWSDRRDPASPLTTYSGTMVLPQDTRIQVMGTETPTFRPSETLLWVPGVMQDLFTRHANGRTVNHTTANERGSTLFLPFGESAGPRAILSIVFQTRDALGLFGEHRRAYPGARRLQEPQRPADGARLVLGVLAAPATGSVETVRAEESDCGSPLKANLVFGSTRQELSIVSDTSHGMLSTGVILFDLDPVKESPREFTLELSAPSGLIRPPRLVRLELGVIPIEQSRIITRELHSAEEIPDWSFELDQSGLCFTQGQDPVVVEVAEASGITTWSSCSLAESGPNDNHYELDTTTRRVAFGNGINGRIPPQEAQVLVSYAVSDGKKGDVARNRRWQVAGFQGAFGVNLDPITGSSAASDSMELRRKARKRSREEHALVTANDIEKAALVLPLQVARAWVAEPLQGVPWTGVVTLVVVRRRQPGVESGSVGEPAGWLEAIRRRLAPRIPLGTRLFVTAPRYIDFTIQALVEAQPRLAPDQVKQAVMNELRKQFAVDDSVPEATPRLPGVPVTARDLRAALRRIEQTRRILDLKLLDAKRASTETLNVPHNGLPRWNFADSTIEVKRSDARSAP